MTRLQWDLVGARRYETGVDHGVLYIPNAFGAYLEGFVWNGLTAVTESPSGAEATPQYADNIKYLNLISAEEFAATIEGFTYPDEFAQCDGTAEPVPGVMIGQQARKTFGLSYRTKVGNDVDASDYGYKLHLVYGCLAAPTEKANSTVNDSPEAMPLSWALTTTAVDVPGYKPSATLVIDSTKTTPALMTQIETILYGAVGVDPRLPMPSEVMALLAGTAIEVMPVAPTMTTNNITIPAITGVTYYIDGVEVSGVVTITEDVVVTALPNDGYVFPAVSDSDWFFDFV